MATPQQLIIPGKNSGPSSYGQDMRTLEVWSRQCILKLVAGSGITLTPSNGMAGAPGQEVEISASGGGGGANVGQFGMECGPDSLGDNTTQNGGISMVGAQWSSFGASPNFVNSLLHPGGTINGSLFTVGGGWVISSSPGASVNLLPVLVAPDFTGGPLTVNLRMGAMDVGNIQQARWNMSKTLTTGQVYQTLAADWTNEFYNGVATLTMTAGTGSTGNGLVDSGSHLWFASLFGYVDTSTITAFT